MGKYTCRECAGDGGFHYDDDGKASRCPNYLSTQLHEEAKQLTSTQNASALKAARQIVRDFAETHAEFSANQCREAMEAAGIPGPTVGAAFTTLAHGTADTPPCIEATGRFVQSSDPATRHRIQLWRSLVHPSYVAAHSSFVGHQKESA